jgi:hypothetical protein
VYMFVIVYLYPDQNFFLFSSICLIIGITEL